MNTQTQTWEHKGFKIEFLPSGKFRTVINGKTTLAPSIDALKRKIDATIKAAPFVEFKALDVPHNPQIYANAKAEPKKPQEPYTVLDLKTEKSRRRYGSDKTFFTISLRDQYGSSPYGERYVVAPDTDEARAAIITYESIRANAEREMAILEERVNAAYAAIPKILAKDYALQQMKGGVAK